MRQAVTTGLRTIELSETIRACLARCWRGAARDRLCRDPWIRNREVGGHHLRDLSDSTGTRILVTHCCARPWGMEAHCTRANWWPWKLLPDRSCSAVGEVTQIAVVIWSLSAGTLTVLCANGSWSRSQISIEAGDLTPDIAAGVEPVSIALQMGTRSRLGPGDQGPMEKGVGLTICRRFKLRGMSWYRRGVSHLLRLRILRLNST